jgi:iron(III) transport system ATP-binding protein
VSAVQLAGITASHQGLAVLQGIDLEVRPGTTTAVLGPSGCGKTTLLRVIAGFHRPDAGTVQLNGETVVGSDLWTPPERRDIGYVPQDGNLFPHLTVGANIAFGLPRRERRRGHRVRELLELVGLDPTAIERRRPDQLSGGQQQRVALARALARQPKVILLDEPFSALDAALRVSTRRAVAQALAHENVTVVLVTHDQAEALSFADQVAVMHDGRFRQVDTPAAVYQQPVDRASAQFLGEAVFLPGQASPFGVTCALGTLTPADRGPRGEVEVMVRPEQIVVRPPSVGLPTAEVVGIDFFGHDALLRLTLPDPESLSLVVRIAGQNTPAIGSLVGLAVTGQVRLFTPAGSPI